MKKSVGMLLIAIFLSGFSVLAQSGRKPVQNQRGDDDAIRLRAEEVLLNVTVTDSNGRQVTDLKRDEFIIAEDGRRQELLSFQISSVPVNVILLLDASGSVVPDIKSLTQAAMGFASELRAEDKVSVMEFHTKVELIQDWTSDAESVKHAISWRFKPGMVQTKNGSFDYGTTALYDALYLAATEQMATVDGRKVIIVLTDGVDTSSKVRHEQALAALTRAGAVVYVVSMARSQVAKFDKYRKGAARVFAGGTASAADSIIAQLENGELMMGDLTKRTGGSLYSPLVAQEMNEVYGQVVRELKNQYILTYISNNTERDGRLRRVGVFLTRIGHKARTREAYYGPKD